jgi:hypothetical protein
VPVFYLAIMLTGCIGQEAGLSALGRSGEDANGVEDAGAHAPPEVPDESDAFFAEGTIYTFHLSLSPDSRSSLAAAPTTWVPGTFSDGTATWPVLVRLKGTTTFRTLAGKAAFKIDFRTTDPETRYHGLKRLTLNSMLQDTSMLHEHVAYWLYRHRGVAAPRHTFARVDLDGVPYGLYGVVETEDEQLLKHSYPEDHDGNLYESNLADFMPGDSRKFVLDEDGGVFAPYDDMETMASAIADAPDDAYVDALAANFDLDLLMNEWAIDLVSGNVDGYARLKNNFMAYHGSNAWYLMPWGHDQSFQWDRSVTNFGEMQGGLLKRCGQVPECVDILRETIEDLMVDWAKGPFVSMVSDESSLIQADCRTDPRAEFPCDVGHVLTFVLNRPTTVQAELDRKR